MIDRLRRETRALHDAVDHAFGAADLTDPAHYARVLTAHARALPASEAAAARVWPALRPRLPLLESDLAELGLEMPRALAWMPDALEAVGALYVVEGSRLGGGLLATSVGADLPSRYFAAVHERGEWRAIRQAIDARAAAGGASATSRIVAGAKECFAIYQSAAQSLLDLT